LAVILTLYLLGEVLDVTEVGNFFINAVMNKEAVIFGQFFQSIKSIKSCVSAKIIIILYRSRAVVVCIYYPKIPHSIAAHPHPHHTTLVIKVISKRERQCCQSSGIFTFIFLSIEYKVI